MLNKIRCFFSNYKRDRSAAAGVEFALVSIPFLLTIFGIMEAGRIMWVMNGVEYVVEETSRYAALNSNLSDDAYETYAQERLSGMLVNADLQIDSRLFASNGVNFIEIDGTYQISVIVSGLLPGDLGVFDFETSARKPVIN